MLTKLITGGVQKAMMCGICCLEGHVINMCPTLQGGDVNAMCSNQGKRKYDPYSNIYNEGWRDTLTLSMDPGTTLQVLTNYNINHLLRIE